MMHVKVGMGEVHCSLLSSACCGLHVLYLCQIHTVLMNIGVRYEGFGLAIGTVPGTQLSQQSCQTKIPSGPGDTSSVLRSRVTGAEGYPARDCQTLPIKGYLASRSCSIPSPEARHSRQEQDNSRQCAQIGSDQSIDHFSSDT
jgi:hypothetical protein